MIPLSYIFAWRQFAPWISDQQVEQDLVISRALVALFQQPHILKQIWLKNLLVMILTKILKL